jgi:GH15 family glucan-1,4-alpha-glucosidase
MNDLRNGTAGNRPIEDYGLIGDCETGALVGRDGSIDWLCWPRFDSGAVFAGLLGTSEHGHWRIAPDGVVSDKRQYRKNTLILETHFTTDGGEAVLIDFMPPRGVNSDIVRLVKGLRGTVKFSMELVIRFGYGHDRPWVRRIEDGRALQAIAGPDMVVLRTPVETRGQDMRTVAEFEVAAGQAMPFVLTYGPSFGPVPAPIDPEQALREAESFWTDWCAGNRTSGDEGGDLLDAAVMRSLITLKALTYAPTGGIVAAVTTSLPEDLGGERNWDYRYCWIRDATISLLALMDAGYYDEAKAWRDWLLRAAAGSPDQLQIMYGIAGERRLSEWTVPWLPGYDNARPVRIGNAAHVQLQLDVFGELMDALYQGRKGGLPENKEAWALQATLLTHLAKVWRQPDAGLWEMRGPVRQFTHSRVMAWVAVDRCIRSVEGFGMDGKIDDWRRLRADIHADVCANGYSADRGAFVQAYGSRSLDASLLLLPALGFLSAEDERFRGTVEAIERELMIDGLVRRYDPAASADGVAGNEGVFLACSFWLADAYAMLGRGRDARALYERLLALRNDLGLLAEEYDPAARRQVGNFPQAFSHVALVNSAKRLGQAKRAQERAPARSG